MSLLVSFLSGILASFTPCVIVLIPLFLYKFFNDGKLIKRELIIFLSGYLLFYVLFGYILKSLLTSQIQNGFKFGLGLLFIILGLLAVFDKLNPLNLPVFKNPILLGLTFALIVSFNPCSLPYLALILTLSNKFEVLINLVLFSIGTLVPAFLFTLFGKSLISVNKVTGKYAHKLNVLMNYILILSGFYVIYTIHDFTKYDMLVIAIFLMLIFAIFLRTSFIIYKKEDIFKLRNIILILVLFSIIFISITHCSYQLNEKKVVMNIFGLSGNQLSEGDNLTCSSSNLLHCKICLSCIYKLSLATFVGFLVILADFLYEKSKQKNKIND